MTEQTPDTIDLWGGTLCLDLANSADWDQDGAPVDPEHNDVLRSVAMLRAWARRLGLGDSAGSLDELHRVRDLRGALHRLFSAIAGACEPVAGDLLLLHEAFA